MLVGPERSNPRAAAIVGGARQCIETYSPLRLQVVVPSDNGSRALSKAVQEALAEQPKAVCLYVGDADAARDAATMVTRKGTVLVTMGVDSGVVGVFGHIDVGWESAAELLGENLASVAGERRSYFLVHRRGACAVATQCYDRFMAETRSLVTLRLLDERNAGESERAVPDLIRAMFARFPHAGLVVTFDPAPWVSVRPRDVLTSEARFVTLCAAPALWPALRAGKAAALVGPLDGEIGSLAVQTAMTGITESTLPGRLRIMESEIVTRENLDDFAMRYAQAAGLDLDELMAVARENPTARP